ncbi:MAG: hypothetical protein ACEY3J_00635 [Arsenophonus sp.]
MLFGIDKIAKVLHFHSKNDMQPKVKTDLRNVLVAYQNRNATNKAINILLTRFPWNYPEAIKNIEKDREKPLVFYNFPPINLALGRGNKNDKAISHRLN